jgi:hypothetical protein
MDAVRQSHDGFLSFSETRRKINRKIMAMARTMAMVVAMRRILMARSASSTKMVPTRTQIKVPIYKVTRSASSTKMVPTRTQIKVPIYKVAVLSKKIIVPFITT